MSEENAPETPVAQAAPQKKRNYTPMAILTAVGTIGVAIVALNTFTGLNFRPAWAYETEKLEAVDAELGERIDTGDAQLAAEDTQIHERLEKVLQIQDATSRTILQMNKGQYDLKLNQIDRKKRELRRELAEHQSRAQTFRDREESVPAWLRDSIADTETTIEELGNERGRVETQLLELEQ